MSFLKKLFGSKPTVGSEAVESAPAEETVEQETESSELQNPASAETEPTDGTSSENAEQVNTEFETLRDDGVRAMRMGEAAYAEKCFRAALERRDDDQVKAFLAEACLRQGEGRAAYDVLTDLLTRHTGDEKLLQAQARAAGLCGDWEAMTAAAKALETVNPDNPNALYYQAQAQRQLKNDDLAVEILTRLLSTHPDTPEILLLRAQTLSDLNRAAEAEKDVDRQIELGSAGEEALCLKGDLRRVQGDSDAAIEYYEQVKALNPFNRDVVIRESEIYLETRRPQEALRVLNEAIDLEPDFAEAYRERGKVKRCMNDETGAAEDEKKAEELKPEQPQKADGEYTNLENRLNEQARMRNPFGF